MNKIINNIAVVLIAITLFVSLTSFVSNSITVILYLVTTLVILSKKGTTILSSKPIKLLAFFYFVVIIYALMGHGMLNSDTFRGLVFRALLVTSVYIMSQFLQYMTSKQIACVLNVAIIAITITVIITTIIGEIEPMALRMYGFGENEDFINADTYFSIFGMMGYPLAHGLSVIIVGMCVLACYSHDKILSIFSALLCFAMIRLQFVSTITTAFIFSLIGCLLVLSYKFSKGKTTIAIGLVVFVFIVMYVTGSFESFISFSESKNGQISTKLSDLYVSVLSGSGEGQMGYREKLYLTSFRTFLSNPLLGWGVDNGSRTVICEHSYFLDYLAYYGLFSLAFFYAWWYQFKLNLCNFNSSYKKLYYITFVPVVALVCLKSYSVCGTLFITSLVFSQLVFLYIDVERKGVI